jgi:hypothetical protein
MQRYAVLCSKRSLSCISNLYLTQIGSWAYGWPMVIGQLYHTVFQQPQYGLLASWSLDSCADHDKEQLDIGYSEGDRLVNR